jgi:hypothetical protein
MSSPNVPDYLRKAKKASEKQGWRWEKREGSKHLMIFDAAGTSVTTVSLTAYDGTLRKKVTSQLRRANCPGLN